MFLGLGGARAERAEGRRQEKVDPKKGQLYRFTEEKDSHRIKTATGRSVQVVKKVT